MPVEKEPDCLDMISSHFEETPSNGTGLSIESSHLISEPWTHAPSMAFVLWDICRYSNPAIFSRNPLPFRAPAATTASSVSRRVTLEKRHK